MSIEDILRSGVLDDTQPALSAAWGTAASASAGPSAQITLDGATAPVTLRTLGPVTAGQRVLTLLAAGSRVVLANVTPPPAPDPWHIVGAAGEPPYAAGWSRAATGYHHAGFHRAGAVVFLRGTVMHSTAVPESTIFTLPAGWRPSERVYLSTLGFVAAAGYYVRIRVDVLTSGDVRYVWSGHGTTSYNGGLLALALDGLSFALG